MPIPLIPIILAAAAALAITVVAILYYDDIINWFHARNDLKTSDANNIAFTIKERLSTGNYKVVQGIFNKKSNKMVDGQQVEAESLSGDISRHRAGELVVYE